MRKTILLIIRIVRRRFYNTPLHRLPFTAILYERLFHIAYAKNNVVRVTHENSLFDVPACDITMLPSLLNDCYETCQFGLLKRVLLPGMTFVDVGANIGLYSVAAAKLVGHTGRVYAFEPEPRNYLLLQRHLVMNEVRNVTIENVAVGSENAEQTLTISKNALGTHSLLKRRQKSFQEEVKVEVIRLDDYFEGIPGKIDVLKIDAEGYEPFVLKGAERLLARVELLLFEYTKNDVQPNFGIANMVRLLGGFPYLYGINERVGKIGSFALSDFNRRKYMNIVAAKKAMQIVGHHVVSVE